MDLFLFLFRSNPGLTEQSSCFYTVICKMYLQNNKHKAVRTQTWGHVCLLQEVEQRLVQDAVGDDRPEGSLSDFDQSQSLNSFICVLVGDEIALSAQRFHYCCGCSCKHLETNTKGLKRNGEDQTYRAAAESQHRGSH